MPTSSPSASSSSSTALSSPSGALLSPIAPPHDPTPLSASQEAAVRDLYHKRVRAHCADEIRDFALCATGRTFTATWACRTLRRAMNACMLARATQAEEDAARLEWFARGPERREERRRQAEQKKNYETFQREWWGEYAPGQGGGQGKSVGKDNG